MGFLCGILKLEAKLHIGMVKDIESHIISCDLFQRDSQDLDNDIVSHRVTDKRRMHLRNLFNLLKQKRTQKQRKILLHRVNMHEFAHDKHPIATVLPLLNPHSRQWESPGGARSLSVSRCSVQGGVDLSPSPPVTPVDMHASWMLVP